MTGKSDATLNYDRLWAALSRSKQFQQLVEQAVKEVEQEAAALARSVAFDEGYYANSFDSGTANAKRVRQLAYAPSSKGNKSGKALRFQQGVKGRNRYLDVKTEGNPDIETYDGELGVVVNTDFKAAMIEFGTAAKGPRRIMLTAVQNVAKRLGMEVEVVYDTLNQENPSSLSQSIKAGIRASGRRPKTGGAA